MGLLTAAFFSKILAIEGGYQADPSDNGNYACGALVGTKYGVSAVAYSTWVNRCPDASEMQSLTKQQAFDFYSWYFDRYNLYPIENQTLFELLANNTMGSPANAAKVEQRVLNQMGYSVAVDGERGAQTITALNKAWRERGPALYNAIREAWIDYLKGLNKPQFLPGWLIRMEKFPPLSTATGNGLGVLLAALLFAILTKKHWA